MSYISLPDALARAKERSGATEVDDEYLNELLQLSAGTAPDEATHYRPFYVAARWLEQNRGQQALESADGAKFTGYAKPIASLMNLQAAYDKSHALTVPDGFEAITSELATQQMLRSVRFGSQSSAPKLNP